MRLLVVSHTPHHHDAGGRLVGWGATVRELDALATLFAEVVHVCPVHPEPAPASALPYLAPNLRVREIAPAGGPSAAEKLGIAAAAPGYLRALLGEWRGADAVHVRAPANVSALAMLVMAAEPGPRRRWIKYAGDWQGHAGEARSHALQRAWLERYRLHRAQVTVNGVWPGQPRHIHSFDNPCLTDEELAEGRAATGDKRLDAPVRLLFVGRLEQAKGVAELLAAAEELARRRERFVLELVGDGPLADDARRVAAESGAEILLHGWLPRGRLGELYARAHLLLLPSRAEGWPKVISEAMAYGVVPIASDVGAIRQTLERCGAGVCLPAGADPARLAEAVLGYVRAPERWLGESSAAVEAAPRFSYRRYLERVRELLALPDRD